MSEEKTPDPWREMLIALAQPFETMDFLPRAAKNGSALALQCQHCGGPYTTTPSEVKCGKGKYCSRRCGFAARSLRARDIDRIAARFWGSVHIQGPDECWEWTALRGPNGYGIFTCRGKMHPAHRIAYELTHGEIPEGLFILHRCDNRPCVNPAHLYAGTKKQNTADMFARGRQGHHKRRSLAGSANPKAKLTEQEACEIRTRFAAGGVTRTQIAQQVGVDRSTVGRIISGATWKAGAVHV